MIAAIKRFFDENLATNTELDTPEISRKKSRLASAALLIEVMNIDTNIDERENVALISVLKKTFDLDDSTLTKLIDLAHEEASNSSSLHEFTTLVNKQFAYEQKKELIKNMWEIAFSDEVLDKYEEHLIRKTADLIYVSHSDFIKTKLSVKKNLNLGK